MIWGSLWAAGAATGAAMKALMAGAARENWGSGEMSSCGAARVGVPGGWIVAVKNGQQFARRGYSVMQMQLQLRLHARVGLAVRDNWSTWPDTGVRCGSV